MCEKKSVFGTDENSNESFQFLELKVFVVVFRIFYNTLDSRTYCTDDAEAASAETQANTHLTIGIAALGIGAVLCGFLMDHLTAAASRYLSMICLIIGFIFLSQSGRGSEWTLYRECFSK